MIHLYRVAAQPIRPHEKDGKKVEEPDDVEEFVAVLLANFQAAIFTNLDVLIAFRLDPR